MARIAGVDIPREKRLEISLTYIFGIGKTTSQKVTTELGLNLAGVEVVLRLEDELRRAHDRLERLERQMREEIDNVHKQYRRDLVLYQTPRPVRTRAQ